MANSSARKIFHALIFSAIQRCRTSETLCRLSVSLKIFHKSNPPLLRISVSDTGVGSSLEEFLRLDRTTLSISNAKWDGTLLITTTGINDKEIHHYRLNLKESLSSRTRLIRLPPSFKSLGTFSGTEVCLSTYEESDSNDYIVWATGFLRKILVLKNPNLAVELIVEQIDSNKSRRDRVLQEKDQILLPFTTSSIECLTSGLADFALKHGNSVDTECQTCSINREILVVGNGVTSNSEKIRGKDQLTVVVAIVVAPVTPLVNCWSHNCSATQVLCFQDYTPSLFQDTFLDSILTIDWQIYGLKLKSNYIDGEGKIILEWENSSFALMDFAIHCYHKTAKQTRGIIVPDRNLVKKAIRVALDDLKSNHTELFLSSQALKIKEYVPDLSRAITGLILSSNDSEFKGECASILGLSSLQSMTESSVESCLSEKLNQIIESNDRKKKGERDSIALAPSLFESENLNLNLGDDEVQDEMYGLEEDYALDI